MNKLNFFTPIVYKSKDTPLSSRVLQKVDNYFYLGGKKAYVIQSKNNDKVVLSHSQCSRIAIAVKVLSYSTIFLPLIMLGIKTALRSKHHYKIINPEEKLKKGLYISDEQINKINGLIPKISKAEGDDDIEWLQKGERNRVFKLKEDPTIVYKFSLDNSNDERYRNMVKAKQICLAHHLSLLVIPHANYFTVGTHLIIAEECLDINSQESAQEEFYSKFSKDLNETIKQLATFVAKSKFNDVTWRNIPTINEEEDFRGPRRAALIDLEHMKSAANGFIGDPNGSRGLIKCVSKDQTDMVIKQGRKKGVSLPSKLIRLEKKARLKELNEDEKLRDFYEKKGIITGNEPIKVDIDTLGLDLNQTKKFLILSDKEEDEDTRVSVTLQEATENVIAEINRLIENSPQEASIKGKRSFYVPINIDPFKFYAFGGKDESWMYQIITALVEKGHIFKLKDYNGHGFYLQA